MSQGLDQTSRQGHPYLFLTDRPEPPPLAPGWVVEPAHLQESSQAEQRGDRWVRLRRLLRTEATAWGDLRECEPEVVTG
jgi:hypothetical protein